MSSQESFAKFGKSFQEKIIQALFEDNQFAEQMLDILKVEYFELKYLQQVAETFFDYKGKYKVYPSSELVSSMISQDKSADNLTIEQSKEFLKNLFETPLSGDKFFVQEAALEFCRKQTIKEAMVHAIDKLEESKFDDIKTVIDEALKKGQHNDVGQDYNLSLLSRCSKTSRQPLPTGWPVIDKALNGGWERKTLTTFIAGTGVGKSMFLVNCAAAGIANGLNVAYVTCEMADYKIGLRVDSYFSAVPINDIPSNTDHVGRVIEEKAKGQLYIKEYATKTATVQTIRNYLQKLSAVKNFTPDILVIDYADLLRGARGYTEGRHEIQGVYEDLRALAQEFNLVAITADQTNRGGMNDELVTLSSISECFGKAMTCDVIFTLSRRPEDKMTNTGRVFVAKSRLGQDGMVYPFVMNTATVKATILDQGIDPVAMFMEDAKVMREKTTERFSKLMSKN
jgi:archaellum biogenesis ATPase FlaH